MLPNSKELSRENYRGEEAVAIKGDKWIKKMILWQP